MAAPNPKPTALPEWASTANTVTPWLASTAYTAGTLKTNGGNVYEVVTGGTSAGSGGPAGTGSAIVDGTITWRYLGKAGTAGGITEPSAGRKQTGWLAGERPPHGYFNWLSNLAYLWTRFLDTFNQYLQIWQNAAVFEGPPAWAPSTAYVVGEYVLNSGKVYVCTVAGTSAGAGGPTGTGTGITDGSVTWDFAELPFDVEVPARTRAGLEATQSTTNGAGLTATGNGTGAGVVGTGGSSNGAGATFTGGATNGAGVVAQGTGTGAGVSATGGTGASAPGVSGTAGTGSNGAGVVGAGNGSGAGVAGTGGATNASGVSGTGGGSGDGVSGTGGGSGGTGVRGTGTGATGNGVEGVGAGSGDGVRGTGAGTGTGGRFDGGATAAPGVTATGGTGGFGVLATGGTGAAGVRAIGPTTNYGVHASSSTGVGVYGESTSASTTADGVAGFSNNTGAGVSGSSAGGPGGKFSRSGDRGSINLVPATGDPASPSNGDIWYNSTTHEVKIRINGVNKTVTVA